MFRRPLWIPIPSKPFQNTPCDRLFQATSFPLFIQGSALFPYLTRFFSLVNCISIYTVQRLTIADEHVCLIYFSKEIFIHFLCRNSFYTKTVGMAMYHTFQITNPYKFYMITGKIAIELSMNNKDILLKYLSRSNSSLPHKRRSRQFRSAETFSAVLCTISRLDSKSRPPLCIILT